MAGDLRGERERERERGRVKEGEGDERTALNFPTHVSGRLERRIMASLEEIWMSCGRTLEAFQT